MSQLVLPLRLADHAVFATYHAAGNEPVVEHLAALAATGTGHGAWIWGAASTGKSHLLQAVCERAGDRSVYVPLAMLAAAGPGPIEGLANRELVCIDDIDRVTGDPGWETALFNLCNELQDAGHQLVVTASSSPRSSNVSLADLQSRLSRLPAFQLQKLDESQRVAALRLRADHRGLELPDDSARYLLRRSRRDMTSLYELLDRLDLEALRAQRKLTIPFVRSVIEDLQK